MKNKKLLLALLLFTQIASISINREKEYVFAETPTYTNQYEGTYYSSVSSSAKTETLLTSLSSIINTDVKTVGYSGVWGAYYTTDVYPGTTKIWDMYSENEYTVGTDQTSGSSYPSYNREHTIPQSWFGEASPMVCDVHHLYPTDKVVNERRGNYPHGDVGSTYNTYGLVKIGASSSQYYSGTVCEVADEYKGDFARTYFYFACRYYSKLQSFINLGKGANAVFKGSFPYLTDFALNTYLEWAKNDPVSEKEIARNNAVYAYQGNRNPFIDHQTWIFDIWDTSYQYNIEGETPSDPTEPDDPVVPDDPVDPDDPIEPTDVYKEARDAFEKINSKHKMTGSFTIKNNTEFTLKNVTINYSIYLYKNLEYYDDIITNLKLVVVEGSKSRSEIKQLYENNQLTPVDYKYSRFSTYNYFYYGVDRTNDLDTVYTACYISELGGTKIYSIPTTYSVRTLAKKYLNYLASPTETQLLFLNNLKGGD